MRRKDRRDNTRLREDSDENRRDVRRRLRHSAAKQIAELLKEDVHIDDFTHLRKVS